MTREDFSEFQCRSRKLILTLVKSFSLRQVVAAELALFGSLVDSIADQITKSGKICEVQTVKKKDLFWNRREREVILSSAGPLHFPAGVASRGIQRGGLSHP